MYGVDRGDDPAGSRLSLLEGSTITLIFTHTELTRSSLLSIDERIELVRRGVAIIHRKHLLRVRYSPPDVLLDEVLLGCCELSGGVGGSCGNGEGGSH